ncbi:MAG: alanine racemase [Deltaproteobacteria bacterium]|nr:alanine racemase [Deltaproteobacteria bacterium]
MTHARSYENWKALLAGVRLPAALVDLDAVARNAALILERLGPGPVTLRIASKSVRVVGLLRHIAALCGARARGLMTFSAHETAWLAERHGMTDLVLAYPIARADEAEALAACGRRPGVRVRAVIDDPAHVELLAAAIAREPSPGLSACVDLDAAWRPLAPDGPLAGSPASPGLLARLGRRVHLGVRRSPVRSAEAALALADHARARGLVVDAVMAYEAQVAGLPDTSRSGGWLDPIRRFVRTRSMPVVTARRREIVQALRAAGHPIALVNGGGTGSVGATAHDGTVTEVTVGSGFLCSHLFDGYHDLPLEPAAFFALPIVRVPDPGFVTCFAGGYLASGPAAADRLPRVHAPAGLTPTGGEGWGEVQTPLAVSRDAPPLAIGDPIIARHAKAGELFERFDRCHLVRGAHIDDVVPTYRGDQGSFG